MRLCLASTSPARLALLRSAGIEPLTASPGVDEAAAAAEAGPLSPHDTVLLLARLKAEDVAARIHIEHPRFHGLIVGGDSMFEIDGQVYGKPHTPEAATARWKAMRGRTGTLHSGHWMIRVGCDGAGDGEAGRTGADGPGDTPGGASSNIAAGRVAASTVSFIADITDDEIERYVATGEPLFVAGAFTIDSLGGPFISRIEGDPSTVVGMSLPTLRRLARELGVEWTALWNRQGL